MPTMNRSRFFIFSTFFLLFCARVDCLRAQQTPLFHSPDSTPLVKNGDFEEWDESGSPSYWRLLYPYPKGSVRLSDLSFSGRASVQGISLEGFRPIIYQTIPVKPHTRYRASVHVMISDGKNGYKGLVITGRKKDRIGFIVFRLKQTLLGTKIASLFIRGKTFITLILSSYPLHPHPKLQWLPSFFDTGLSAIGHRLLFLPFSGPVLGYHLTQHPTNGFRKQLDVTFDSDDYEAVSLWLSFGFSEDTDVRYDAATMIETGKVPAISNERNLFRDYILASAGLHAGKTGSVHSRVLKLAQFVNETLTLPDGERRANIVRKFQNDMPYYFCGFMRQDLQSVQNRYCQCASLALSEVCEMVGIATREIHCQDQETGDSVHQFIEYLDPSTRRWIILDPYYGIQLKDDWGNLIGVSELRSSRAALEERHVVRQAVKGVDYSWKEIQRAYNAKLERGLVFFSDLKESL